MPVTTPRRAASRPSFADLPELLTRDHLTELLHVGAATLTNYVRCHGFPRPVEVTPRTFRWWKADVLRWLKGRGRPKRGRPPKVR
jgi:predicted DNA-binding transcriptional regulator AlpA